MTHSCVPTKVRPEILASPIDSRGRLVRWRIGCSTLDRPVFLTPRIPAEQNRFSRAGRHVVEVIFR